MPLTVASAQKILSRGMMIRAARAAGGMDGASYCLSQFTRDPAGREAARIEREIEHGNLPEEARTYWEARLLDTTGFIREINPVGTWLVLLEKGVPQECLVNADRYRHGETFRKVGATPHGSRAIDSHQIAAGDTAESLAAWVIHAIDNA
jgi:hypothetical protein